jgi:hypothetical protein
VEYEVLLVASGERKSVKGSCVAGNHRHEQDFAHHLPTCFDLGYMVDDFVVVAVDTFDDHSPLDDPD